MGQGHNEESSLSFAAYHVRDKISLQYSECVLYVALLYECATL
jgi:hypothetical protein